MQQALDVEQALATEMTLTINEVVHHPVTCSDRQILAINNTDKRQYSSIAYALLPL